MHAYSKRFPTEGTRRQLILEGARKAASVRRTLATKMRLSPTDPVCVADAAINLGVDVRYTNDIKSMEGFYVREPKPLILVSSLRPAGRQNFTAAHELGHHVFGHEGHVMTNTEDDDEQPKSTQSDPNETLVDAFACHFLMPKIAILSAVKQRNLSLNALTEKDIYALSWFFGVGYNTLIRHMQSGIGLISQEHAAHLRIAPKKIRESLIGKSVKEDVIPVDLHWENQRPVDAQIGDLILLPSTNGFIIEGSAVLWLDNIHNHKVLRADKTGTVRLVSDSDWAVYLRVAKRDYVGLARYRFLPEDEEDEI